MLAVVEKLSWLALTLLALSPPLYSVRWAIWAGCFLGVTLLTLTIFRPFLLKN